MCLGPQTKVLLLVLQRILSGSSYPFHVAAYINEKNDNKQCLLDNLHTVMVNKEH